MKKFLRTLFSPILNPLEAGEAPYAYKPSHRTVLLVMSLLFSVLAVLVLIFNTEGDIGYLFPAVVFGLLALVGLIVGLLGSDRAVAKIWGNR